MGGQATALVCEAGVTRVARSDNVQPMDDGDGRCQLLKRELLADDHHWILASAPRRGAGCGETDAEETQR